MSEVFDLTRLYSLQKELDEDIASRHGVTYESTFHKRLLALLVELGEFANETRDFKYWSLKGPSPKDVILEEYIDGLHFLLSLGIPLGVRTYTHKVEARFDSITEALLSFYKGALNLKDDYRLDPYLSLVDEYLDMLPLFGASVKEAIDSYIEKCGKNHKRQEDHY